MRAEHSRQRAILETLADAAARRLPTPTLRELGAAVGITSTSVMRYHIDKLADVGLLVHEPRTSRGLMLTDAGYRAIDRVSPLDDAALGARLREAAARSRFMALVMRRLVA